MHSRVRDRGFAVAVGAGESDVQSLVAIGHDRLNLLLQSSRLALRQADIARTERIEIECSHVVDRDSFAARPVEENDLTTGSVQADAALHGYHHAIRAACSAPWKGCHAEEIRAVFPKYDIDERIQVRSVNGAVVVERKNVLVYVEDGRHRIEVAAGRAHVDHDSIAGQKIADAKKSDLISADAAGGQAGCHIA